MERDSFIFYRSFWDAFREMGSARDRLAIYEAIARYALLGIEPEGLKGEARICWPLIKPQIDANNKRYLNGKRGASSGAKGGRPKGADKNPDGVTRENPNGVTEETPLGIPAKTPNGNANANVNENENVNANANGPRVFPPGREQVLAYAQAQGYPAGLAEKWMRSLEGRNWTVNGEPLRDWKRHLDSWARTERASVPPVSPSAPRPDPKRQAEESRQYLSEMQTLLAQMREGEASPDEFDAAG